MHQEAPDPAALFDLVATLSYKPGWTFWIDHNYERDPGSTGMTLFIQVYAPNTDAPETMTQVNHLFAVPPATYNRASWQRWLLDRLLQVEQHEACEFFRIAGEQPYGPNHGPGEDPYRICELTTDEARRTTFRGEVVPASEQLEAALSQAKEKVQDAVAVQRAGEQLTGLSDLRLRGPSPVDREPHAEEAPRFA